MKLRFVIAANTGVQFFGRLITSGITFVTTILIAREFGAAGYGDFTKITNFAALFYLISDFGFNAIFLQEKMPFAKFLGTRLVFSALLAGICIIIPFFLPFEGEQGFPPHVRMGIALYALTIITQALLTTANAIFQRHLRYDKSVIASSMGSIATLFLVVLSIHYGFSLLLTIAAFVIGATLTALSSLYFAGKFTALSFQFDLTFTKQLFTKALPLGLMLLFNLVSSKVDWFVLSLTANTADVGIYGLAYKFFEFPLSLPIFFMNSVYPILLVRREEGRQAFNSLMWKAGFFLFVSSLTLSIILFFLSPLFTFIKSEFYESILPFRILILSLPFFFLSSLLQWVIIALRGQKKLAVVYFSSMIVAIVLNVIFTPKFGYVAAAAITVIAEVFVLLTLSVYAFTLLRKKSILHT